MLGSRRPPIDRAPVDIGPRSRIEGQCIVTSDVVQSPGGPKKVRLIAETIGAPNMHPDRKLRAY